MKIIKRGSVPEDPIYFGICRNCKTEVEATKNELQHNGSAYKADCPVCSLSMGFCSKSSPVSELNLSIRSHKCMVRNDIDTIAELLHKTADDLLECKNFGITSLNEIRQRLMEYGLALYGE